MITSQSQKQQETVWYRSWATWDVRHYSLNNMNLVRIYWLISSNFIIISLLKWENSSKELGDGWRKEKHNHTSRQARHIVTIRKLLKKIFRNPFSRAWVSAKEPTWTPPQAFSSVAKLSNSLLECSTRCSNTMQRSKIVIDREPLWRQIAR